MKIKSIYVISIIMVIVFVSACSSEETPEPVPDEVSTIQQPRVVSAEAFVVPVQQANLSFEVGGLVADIGKDNDGNKIEEGSWVEE
ncbi:MAG: hypothetical protein GY797_18020, partial [Deltaproteobacteria bacterium]|nr:hypothetical protein [Deltaproteobacteria bacterium]